MGTERKWSIGECGLVIGEKLTFSEWRKLGRITGSTVYVGPWLVGDWVNYGEAAYGEKYTQAIDETGLSPERLRVCSWVANRYRLERRRRELSFEAHRELAFIDDDAKQDKALELAIKNGWGAKEIRDWKRGERDNKHTPLYRFTFEGEPIDDDDFTELVEELKEVCEEYDLSLSRVSRPSD